MPRWWNHGRMDRKHMPQEHIFVLGGARSGKTAFAEKMAHQVGVNLAYLATAQARDDEMAARIAAHRTARAGRFATIEEPLDLCGALRGATAYDVVLVDCITLWLSNLMEAGRDIAAETEALVATLGSLSETRVIMVSNEVGLGIVPDNALARAFRDEAGRMNQILAATATHAFFVMAGLTKTLKGAQQHQLQRPA